MRCTTWSDQVGVVAAAIGIACLPLAAPAHADNDGWVHNGYMTNDEYNYLAKLRESGVRIPLPTGALVQDGHLICENLRRGVRPDDPEKARYYPPVGMPQMIATAQSELCPDTLH
jgi:hypothetical protein